MTRRAGAAFLLDIHSHREMMINKHSWGIGRHLSNELVIDDPYISRFHARISYEREQYYVEDMGSTNGTYFNDELLSSRRRIRHGDRLQVGKSEFIFVVPIKTPTGSI
jgi:pSer/pThr/pTyr-binding forkhead associated (FHA) protein